VCGRTKLQAFLAGTKLDAHHVVPKQKLKRICKSRRLDPVKVVWDVRNRVWVCQQPCHAEHTNAKRRIPRSRLSAAAYEFAREYGVLYVIDREYL
jgi:hypothetical protein